MQKKIVVNNHSISRSSLSSLSIRLNGSHRQELIESGIPEVALEKLGHFSAGEDEINAFLGFKLDRTGLVFKYCDIQGKSYTKADGKPFYRVKPLYSQTEKVDAELNGERLTKYFSPSKNGCRPYFSPLVNWKVVAQKASIPIRITEGEKKSDCLSAYGLPTVGLGGVNSWVDRCPRPGEVEKLLEFTRSRLSELEKLEKLSSDEKKEKLELTAQLDELNRVTDEFPSSRPLPELDEIEWSGRKVYVTYDSDLSTNNGVQNALFKLAVWLTGKGAFVHAVLLPSELIVDIEAGAGKNGVDDFIHRYGVDWYRRLEQIALPVLTKNQNKSFQLNPKIVNPPLRVQGVMGAAIWSKRMAYRVGIGFYAWTSFLWKSVHKDEIARDLIQLMDSQNWDDRSNSHKDSLLKEIAGRLTRDVWNPSNLLQFANGTLDIETGEFREISLNDYITTARPYCFDLNAQCPRFENFLKETFNNDPGIINLVRAWLRYAPLPLSEDSPARLQKNFELLGPKGSGKGTLLQVFTWLVGSENIASINVARTFNDPTALHLMIDKLLAIDSDAKGFMENCETFNKIVSNEPVDVRVLYSGWKNMRLCTKVLIAYNEEIKTPAGAEGTFRRRTIIPIEKEPARPDPNLGDALKSEIAGIFAWAWQMGHEEMEAAIQNANQLDAVKETAIDNLRENIPTLRFLEDRGFFDGDYTAKYLYSEFQEWCRQEGIQKPKSNQSFGKDITRLFGKRSKKESNGATYRIIPNLKDPLVLAKLVGISTLTDSSGSQSPLSGSESGNLNPCSDWDSGISGSDFHKKDTKRPEEDYGDKNHHNSALYISDIRESSPLTATENPQNGSGQGVGGSGSVAIDCHSLPLIATEDGLTQADNEAIEFLTTDYDTAPALADIFGGAGEELIEDRDRAISHFADRLRPLGKDDVDEAANIIFDMKPYSHDVRQSVWDLMKFRNDARSAMKKALREYPELRTS